MAMIGQSRTVYEINDDFNRKSQIFLTSVYFLHKLIYGVPLELVTALGVKY